MHLPEESRRVFQIFLTLGETTEEKIVKVYTSNFRFFRVQFPTKKVVDILTMYLKKCSRKNVQESVMKPIGTFL